MSVLGYLASSTRYWARRQILRQDLPFLGTLIVNGACNLRCRQCTVSNRGSPDLSYEDCREGLLTFERMGIQSLVISGGEPFLWRGGGRTLEDLVQLAHRLGFKIVMVYTNGTRPLRSSADTVFVSLDGLKQTNDDLRGECYDQALDHIRASSHPNLFINFTINRRNQDEIQGFCETMGPIRQIRGVFFYFYTPSHKPDDLFLGIEEKRQIIDRLLSLKKRGFKIANSTGCLKMVHRDTWKRPTRHFYMYADNKLYECCRSIEDPFSCEHCGYLGYAELVSIIRLNPSAILSAVTYLPRSSLRRNGR